MTIKIEHKQGGLQMNQPHIGIGGQVEYRNPKKFKCRMTKYPKQIQGSRFSKANIPTLKSNFEFLILNLLKIDNSKLRINPNELQLNVFSTLNGER
jgi:hypothetical protein